MSEQVVKKNILDVSVIAILRGVEKNFFKDIVQASFSVGLQAIEVTMNTRGVEEILKESVQMAPQGMLIGAGTVCSKGEAEKAIGSGAMFLVTPNFNKEVIEYGTAQKVPVVSGSLTPTEVYNSWQAGASMIKVFPCSAMGGPQYIRELLGPYDTLPLVAVGGVNNENMHEYFQAGVQAVGVSTALFGKEALAEKNINELTKNVKDFIGSIPKG